ncbi:hypothetical protein BDF14DRAFT_1835854 [Spinellus fusiger]|nr:hypothetical protein BDF14DRAFT_1835854 [Spinellus fusiger]
MKSPLVIFVTICLFLCLVTAQTIPFYITSPLPNSTYTAGQPATITWINGINTQVKAELLYGNNPLTMVPTPYSFVILDGKANNYTVMMPSGLFTSETYAFRFSFEQNGTSTNVFAGPFSIKNSANNSTTTSPSTRVFSSTVNSTVLPASQETRAPSTPGNENGQPAPGSTGAPIQIRKENYATGLKMKSALLWIPLVAMGGLIGY